MAEYSPAILLCASPFQPIIDGAAKALVGDRHHGDAVESRLVKHADHGEQVGRRFLQVARAAEVGGSAFGT